MYLWIKALHVMAVISWMAGIFYMPRLFVYHSQVGPGPQSELFKVMERRLYRIIMGPAMTVAWLTGVFLAADAGLFKLGWFHAKLLLVVMMTVVHVFDGVLMRIFARDANQRSERFFRVFNEVPTVLMIGVVILVVVKPF